MGGLSPTIKIQTMNQFVILSFGVDPLNWPSFSERWHVAHMPGAPMDSLLKQNNWKYLHDLTRTRVTKISRISWMRHFPVNWFFYSEGQSFFLHGQDKDNDSFTWPLVKLYWDCAYRQGKPPSFSTYSCERLNFPALAKIRSYSVTFVRERLQLLRWFFTWTTHLFSRKKLSLPREDHK